MLNTKNKFSKDKPSPKKAANDDWLKLCGAWNDMEETAEELIKLIRTSRVSTRQIESLD